MEDNKKLKTRDEIPKKYKWDIENIYKNIDDWNKDFDKLKDLSTKISSYASKLNNAQMLLDFLKLREETFRIADKLYVYAHCRADEDTTNTTFQALKDKIFSFLAQLSAKEAFFVPEILSIGETKIFEEINEIQDLKVYTFFLEDILKLKPHTLNKEQEKILASVSDCLVAPGNIYNMLSNADMTFPKINDEFGKEVELTDKNYSIFIRSKNRSVRKNAFTSLFNTYYKYKNTFGTCLVSSMKSFIFNSKVRNFKSSLESSLKPNNIPTEVYDNTINAVNDTLSSLHRYVDIKKNLLNLDEIHMYDLYVPVVDYPESHVEFETAVSIVNEGLKPLGQEYLDIFKKGIDKGWVDIFENRGKRGGAYSSGCYDTMPYILLNYNYSLNDVFTLAHEMGHSIHSYYSKKHQPYIYSDYTLFCAEVASTTNECLLINHMIDNEKDKNKKLYLINHQLEQIRTTVFRQVMFAEFEKITHEKLENGYSLTADDLCSIWHDLNLKYFGDNIIIDKEIDIEWARIPHFYSDFYVYQYATGYAAANYFASNILKNGESAVEEYKKFLKSGGSDYPINILKNSGVDMTSKSPIKETIHRFNELLDIIEK